MSRIIAASALAAVFLVTACTHKSEPVIVTKDVNIAVPVPCTVDTKNQRPALLTLKEFQARFDAAPNVDTKAQLMTSQLLAHMGWLPVVEGAMQGCEMAPKGRN